MTDREIFKSAVHALPSLILPLFVTLAGARLLEYGSTVLCAKIMLPYLTWENPVYFAAVIAGFLLLALFFSLADCLASLGCYRLCLARGLGKQGRMPWTIFGQWGRYKSWLLWVGFVPVFWKIGKTVLRLFLANRLDLMTYSQIYDGKSYFDMAVVILISPFLLMLLNLSVRTAYLRTPKRGFWRALIFGLAEGFRKWPKTIGAQLKFVVPVIYGVNLVSALIYRCGVFVGGPVIPLLCGLIRRLLDLMEAVWIMVLYGFLAAERYDPPGRA